MVTEFIHFFERHQSHREELSAPTRVLELVDLDKVLHCALNYGLHYVHAYMEEATPFIHRVVERYTKRESLTLSIPEDVHMHIRPVSLIAKVVEHHKTPVNITIGDSTCFAGSIVQVLMALGACPAAKEVSFEGDQTALEDLKLLFEHRLGESGQGALPEKLSYLGL